MLDDVHVLKERARAAASRGDLGAAIGALMAAAGHTHLEEREYVALLRPLQDMLAKHGDARGALTVLSYLASKDASEWKRAGGLMQRVPPVDPPPALPRHPRPPAAPP